MVTDWNTEADLFRYTRGRFTNDEKRNLAIRSVDFDMNQLARIAASSIGAEECVTIEKCVDGMYNKAYILTMDNGKEVIAKVPNLNAGEPHFTTASEVATMDFMRNVLNTPVPEVYSWSSRADDNPVGIEYIIMEKARGIPLVVVWDDLPAAAKAKILAAVSKIHKSWLSLTFSRYGALYYSHDVDEPSSDCLYINDKGERINNPRFSIGRASGRSWVDVGRARVSYDRGPWQSATEYCRAAARRELNALQSITKEPKQLFMICGPKLYSPSPGKKKAAIEAYEKIVDWLIPTDATITAGQLWHNDMHDENIFVDPEDVTKITAIIDWQSVDIAPLFDHHPDPAFLAYQTLELEEVEMPPRPNLTGLSREESRRVTDEYEAKVLFVIWRDLVKRRNPVLQRSISFRNSVAYGLIFTISRIFEYGEAHFWNLVLELRDSWSTLSAVEESEEPIPFPLDLSGAQVEQIQEDYASAANGIRVMEEIKSGIGEMWSEKGIVDPEHYGEAMEVLRDYKGALLHNMVHTEEDRAEFNRYWPFDV
ncbi:MAG: hypothetical protein M1820_009325 [Bogoriella megaspora]|nr:MAG: hypothetical protein M1820_009325 [Bogoriella megaspora]